MRVIFQNISSIEYFSKVLQFMQIMSFSYYTCTIIFLLTGLRIYTGEYKAQGPTLGQTLCPTEGQCTKKGLGTINKERTREIERSARVEILVRQ